MATLPQRFKLLATRCAVAAPSPSRSPATMYGAGAASPGYRLRRHRRRRGGGRLRRFLCRRVGVGGGGGGTEAVREQEEYKRPLVGRGGRTLRDLFVSSPEGARRRGGGGCDGDGEEEEEEGGIGGFRSAQGGGGSVGGGGGRRFVSGGLRSLLMRRSWRPVLVAIPEGEGKPELATIEE